MPKDEGVRRRRRRIPVPDCSPADTQTDPAVAPQERNLLAAAKSQLEPICREKGAQPVHVAFEWSEDQVEAAQLRIMAEIAYVSAVFCVMGRALEDSPTTKLLAAGHEASEQIRNTGQSTDGGT